MDDRALLEAVLARYDPAYRPRSIVAASGGLSAGSVWRLETAAGPLCLRAWPPGIAAERVAWIHAAVEHAARSGCDLLPGPIRSRSGTSFQSHAGEFWELAPWLPGTADFHADPRPERLKAAMQSLAAVHTALLDFRTGDSADFERETPAVAERIHRISDLQGGERERILAASIPPRWPELAELRRTWNSHFLAHAAGIQERLAATLGRVPIQPCLRDIWHAHVLFAGDRVTGIVDLGAMRFDTRATDLARLLGSLVGDDRARWHLALAAYREANGLTAEEDSLAYLLDEANVLLTPATWLRWLLLEGRTFTNPTLVRERLRVAYERLKVGPRLPSGPDSDTTLRE